MRARPPGRRFQEKEIEREGGDGHRWLSWVFEGLRGVQSAHCRSGDLRSGSAQTILDRGTRFDFESRCRSNRESTSRGADGQGRVITCPSAVGVLCGTIELIYTH